MEALTPIQPTVGLRARKNTFAFSAAVLSLLLAATAASGYLLYKAGLDDWREDLSTLSLVMAENTAQTITSAELVLDSIISDVGQAHAIGEAQLREKFDSVAFSQALRNNTRGLPQISGSAVFDRNGNAVVLSSEFPTPPLNVADREYFSYHQAHQDAGTFLSAPTYARYNGVPTFYLTRRIDDDQGHFLGVALVALPCAFFEKFFENINREKKTAVTLYRDDYKPLAWWPADDSSNAATSIGPTRPSNIPAPHLVTRNGTQAQFFRESGLLGMQRLVRDHPMIVEISITERAYIDEWLQLTYPLLAVAGISLVSLLAAFFMMIRLLKRHEQDAAIALALQADAEEANAAKSRFLAMVSHEIRTPMNGMLGIADLLQESGLPPQQAQYARHIHSAASGLMRIINDILDFSKIESGHLDIESIPFSPAALVRERMALYRPTAEKKLLQLEAEILCDDHLMLLGDPSRLSQVLGNLLSNAIKFTAVGTVKVALSAHDAGDDSVRLHMAVIDTGMGMSRETQRHLFEPFSQADSSISRKYGGTGLGLAICKTLVELMGGTIRCHSVPGLSTEFDFDIVCKRPQDAAPESVQQEAPVAPRALAAAPPNNTSADMPRVLVADDTEINRQFVHFLLSRQGYTVDQAIDGKEACDAVRTRRYDLVLMDCQMPLMDGFDATQCIRAAETQQQRARVPIVALTASTLDSDRDQCLAAGMDDFLTKPFAAPVFLAMVDKWCRRPYPEATDNTSAST